MLTSVCNTSLGSLPELFAQRIDFPKGSFATNPTPAEDSYAAGVIAPVLQPSQAVDQDWRGSAVTEIADDSTH